MFLATVGTVGVAGCSGYFPPSNSQSTENPEKQPKQSTTTSSAPKDDSKTKHSSTVQTFEDFENIKKWHAVEQQGTLKASSKAYQGSTAAHIVGSKQTKEGKIFRANFGGKPVDLRGKNLSLMYRCTSHDYSKIAVQLYAPDQGHIVEMKRTLYGPKGNWVRINLGVTGDQRVKTIDLSKVYEIYIIGRPVDSNSTKPIEFFVDDLKTVPTPKKGKVMLTFDDGLASHFTTAYKMMKGYGFPGVEAVITEAVYDDGFLTQSQMRKMVQDGWDMIAHPNVQSSPMNKIPRKEQEKLMKQSKGWLKQYGYEGHKYMAVPKNVVGPNTFELAQKHFDLTMTFGASPNALPVITKDTLISRIYGDSSMQETKSAIDYAARYNQLSVLLFHKFGSEGFSKKQFKSVLNYLKKSTVEVVTVTDLKEQGLLL
jgi:peptidoglycan/xylan/chitin deacetylase (PgdA/CDA1 family)